MSAPSTVAELIEALQELTRAHPEALDLPLRIAYQHSWPLVVGPAAVTIGQIDDGGPALVIVAGESVGRENPYGDKSWWGRGESDLGSDYERECCGGGPGWDEDEVVQIAFDLVNADGASAELVDFAVTRPGSWIVELEDESDGRRRKFEVWASPGGSGLECVEVTS